jgi:hypothetical protein
MTLPPRGLIAAQSRTPIKALGWKALRFFFVFFGNFEKFAGFLPRRNFTVTNLRFGYMDEPGKFTEFRVKL